MYIRIVGTPSSFIREDKEGDSDFSSHKYGALGKIGGVLKKNKKGGYHLFSY